MPSLFGTQVHCHQSAELGIPHVCTVPQAHLAEAWLSSMPSRISHPPSGRFKTLPLLTHMCRFYDVMSGTGLVRPACSISGEAGRYSKMGATGSRRAGRRTVCSQVRDTGFSARRNHSCCPGASTVEPQRPSNASQGGAARSTVTPARTLERVTSSTKTQGRCRARHARADCCSSASCASPPFAAQIPGKRLVRGTFRDACGIPHLRRYRPYPACGQPIASPCDSIWKQVQAYDTGVA